MGNSWKAAVSILLVVVWFVSDLIVVHHATFCHSFSDSSISKSTVQVCKCCGDCELLDQPGSDGTEDPFQPEHNNDNCPACAAKAILRCDSSIRVAVDSFDDQHFAELSCLYRGPVTSLGTLTCQSMRGPPHLS